ncbi:MAG TPA: M48 family metalloprotease, partial [Leptolyngbyaceae cyanobacterium M33_DOE_097]|nr:M48 family metalloprotease [Leptolyngbyaceae cyanobacterium M33_DOE_097]
DAASGAIALPNNKIFVSAGSIANTNSEAELASLIGRQMGHAVLSHPNKIAQRGNITSTLTRLLPAIGGLVSPKVREFNNSTTGTLVSGLIGNLSNGLLKPNYTSQMVNDATKAGSKLVEAAGYGSGSLLNISTGSDRHAQVKAKVQQLLGTAQPWWSLGR